MLGKGLEVLLVPTSLSPSPRLPLSCVRGQSHKQTSVLPQAVGWGSSGELKMPFGPLRVSLCETSVWLFLLSGPQFRHLYNKGNGLESL